MRSHTLAQTNVGMRGDANDSPAIIEHCHGINIPIGQAIRSRDLPEELMNKLRVAKLARGVPGKRSERTETYPAWFVFLSYRSENRFWPSGERRIDNADTVILRQRKPSLIR